MTTSSLLINLQKGREKTLSEITWELD